MEKRWFFFLEKWWVFGEMVGFFSKGHGGPAREVCAPPYAPVCLEFWAQHMRHMHMRRTKTRKTRKTTKF